MPDKVKVVFVNRYFWPDESATSQILSDLAFYLEKQANFQVEIITSNQLYTDASHRMQSLEEQGNLRIHRVWTTRFGRANLVGRAVDYLTFYLSATFKMYRVCKAASWLIVKTDPPMLSVLGAIIKWFRPVKLGAWCQDVFPEIAFARKEGSLSKFFDSLLKKIRNWSLERTDKIIVLGKDMETYFTHELANKKALAILPNGADGKNIQPIPIAESTLRKEWQFENSCVLGYSGNLGRVHEFNTLVKAAAQLVDTTELKLLFIGGGALQQKLKAELPADVARATHFKPYQPREALSASMAVPDIHWFSLEPSYRDYVLPSKFYGILAAGRPTIFVGDCNSEVAQIIEVEQIGFAVEPGATSELAQKITTLIEQPELREQMGQRARAYFEQNYDYCKIAEKWARELS